jgi:thiol:disulfide interchange protein DsbD
VVAKGVAVDAGAGSAWIDQAKAEWPVATPWQVELREDGSELSLRLSGDGLPAVQNQDVVFYPEQWGPIVYGSEQLSKVSVNSIEIRLKPGDQPLTTGQTLNGVLALGAEGVVRGYRVSALFSGVSKPRLAEPASADLELSSALLLALLGGVILNLMPCVFPVLSIKALAVLQQSGHARRQTRLHGWAYAAGILASFAGLAGVLLLLKAGGASIGWGFQFQTPLFVLCLAYIMFAVGLSLSGVFTIGGSLAGIGSGLAARSGYTGSFFTGVLAAVVATPCTAPFMGAAIGFALSQPGLVMLEVFLSLGAGLALPYWLLCHWPTLQRCLPKPGLWMLKLKQGLAFPMYAATTWLIWVLARQAGPNAVAVALAGCVAISFAAWLYQISLNANGGKRRLGTTSAGLLLALAISTSYFSLDAPAVTAQQCDAHNKNLQTFSAEDLRRLRADGKPVFVNLTADWCISCLVNERVALSSDAVLNTFREAGVVYLKGDWTNRDPAISSVLAEYGRSGVPLYLYFAPGVQAARVLPQILTPDIVINTITGVVKL